MSLSDFTKIESEDAYYGSRRRDHRFLKSICDHADNLLAQYKTKIRTSDLDSYSCAAILERQKFLCIMEIIRNRQPKQGQKISWENGVKYRFTTTIVVYLNDLGDIIKVEIYSPFTKDRYGELSEFKLAEIFVKYGFEIPSKKMGILPGKIGRNIFKDPRSIKHLGELEKAGKL